MFIARAVAKTVEAEARAAAARSQEAMALLLGDRFVDPDTGVHYAVATERVTGPLVSTTARVRFDGEGFGAVAEAMDRVGFDYLVVGWYHSHVGLGVRPSSIDAATHRRYFPAPHQFALILDTVHRQAAAYGLVSGELAARPLRVFGPDPHRP